MGRRIAEVLAANKVSLVVVEQVREVVEQLRAEGLAAVTGDASDAEVLVQAHIAQARMLVIASPNTLELRHIIATARALNSTIETVVRTHNEVEATLLRKESAGAVLLGAQELALAISRHVLKQVAIWE